MSRKLPSLNAIKAFEAAARNESFTKAAVELFVTQGAVSQQVKALEGELGMKLFNREHQRLSLTDSGREYLNIIRDAFDRISVGTARITQQYTSNVLTVSTSPDFAAKWLVHRLGRFAEKHPEIDLRVIASLHHVDFATEDVDMAVRHGTGDWAGLDATELCPEVVFPVCSPGLLKSKRGSIRPASVLNYPLLHISDRSGWTRWLKHTKVPYDSPLQGLIMNRDSMVIDASINGLGFALARASLAQWDLHGGRIVAPVDVMMPIASSYWIVSPRVTAKSVKIATFKQWLTDEASDDKRRLREHFGRDIFSRSE